MRTEQVEFFSDGELVRANWLTPDAPAPRMSAVIQGPGWFGLKDAKAYVPYHVALTDAGLGVLCIDYRGFGDSEGEPGWFSLSGQLEDLRQAFTYLTTREDVDPEAIGAFGTGGTGGGNVVLLAAHEPRVRAVVSQFPVGDGRQWLRGMRSEDEWLAFLDEVEQDSRTRVLKGKGRRVPRESIMIPTKERTTSGFKSDVDARIGGDVPLAVVDEILRYRPAEQAVGLTAPLMLIGVERDATTPIEHAKAIYARTRGIRRLVVQRHTTHYASYTDLGHELLPMIVSWFTEHLRSPGAIVVRDDEPEPFS